MPMLGGLLREQGCVCSVMRKRGSVRSAIVHVLCRINHTRTLFPCQKGLNIDNFMLFKLIVPLSGSLALIAELPGGPLVMCM